MRLPLLHLRRLLTALLGNGSQKSLPSNPLLGKPRPAGRPDGHPAGGRSSRTVVGGARGVSGAEKKIIWSRRPCLAASIKCDERPFRGGDTSYYNVWSPSPSRPAGGKSPDDQKHDLNLSDLTWPDFQGFLTSFWWLFGFKNVTFSL